MKDRTLSGLDGALIDREQERCAGFAGRYAPALLSALAGMAVFLITLGGTYVYDDVLISTYDTRLWHPAEWGRIWIEQSTQSSDKLFRPLVLMTYALQWSIHGNWAMGFHAVNILLHSFVCALVAELARRLGGLRVAYIAGLLFAVHPVHVEAVAGIVGRAEELCAAGMIGGLLLLLTPNFTPKHTIAVMACFFVAVLSKEQGMLFPLLAGIVVLMRRWNPALDPLPRKTLMILAASLMWGLGGYIIYRESFIGFYWDRRFIQWTVNPLVSSTGLDRWLMPLVLLGRYVALLLAPTKLSIDYGGRVIGYTTHASDPYLWFGVASILLAIVLLIIGWRQRSMLLILCVLSFAMLFGMVSNFAALIGTIFAERLMYLPSAFFLILIARGLASLPRKMTLLIVTVAVVLGSIRTWTYAERWNTPLVLFEKGMYEFPGSIMLPHLLSDNARKQGDLELAWRAAQHLLQNVPESWVAYTNAAVIAAELGNFEEADRLIKIAWEMYPDLPVANIASDIIDIRKAWEAKHQKKENSASPPTTLPAAYRPHTSTPAA